MDEQKRKRLRQRLEADIKAGLVIGGLLLAGYAAGRVTAHAACTVESLPPAKAAMVDKLERVTALPQLEYLGEFKATYYCCEPYAHICGTGDCLTATGVPVAPGIVAVDPSVIPLGSTVVIDGEEYLAADTGGLIKGNRIDIAVPTHAEALELGVQQVEVWAMPE